MAWEEITFQGMRGVSGDKPIDEMALALKRIASHYEEAFSRRPSLAEVLYALATILSSYPGRYNNVANDQSNAIFVSTPLELSHDGALEEAVLRYEGAFSDRPPPGYHIIQTKATALEPEIE